MASTRRLTAILAADVAGYSRLMGADEEGTHERLKAHRRELVEPKITKHRGRIVKTTGDGMLVEFASVVDAVRCAAEVQDGMTERNAAAPANQRIEFRIGIHQGDVVIEDNDIFGDAVNVAARLEALAEPGGICVSARVRGDAVGKLDLAFEDMGQQQLKNIARPVRAYALRQGVAIDPPTPSVAASPPVAQPAVTPRLSIVVLPFANLSSDPEQQYFADGITEDLTTDLSRIAHMLVISRNTAFTYRGKPIDTKQIGRELGVRYVLEGSVRRLGNQIRINAQLIDAEADAHLWAERFTGDTSDLFALQDEITSRIAVALNLELINVEAARPTDNPNTLDYIFRGRAAFSKPQSQDSFSDFSEAVGFFERAVALDPKSVEARSWLATALAVRKLNGITASATTDIARAKALVGQALAASPRSPLAHFANGQVLRAQGRHEEAIPEFEEVIAFNRNWVGAYGNLGQCKFFVARVEEAIPLVVQAIRLSPRDPSLDSWYTWIGRMHLVQSRVDEAIICFEKARSANPASMIAHASLASAHALRGETERAAADLAEARRLSPDDRHSSIARLKAAPIYIGAPKILALFETTYFAGLRLAGMPED